jgi:phage-related minor tail protein
MDRKNENVEDIIETLEKAANLLKGILGMPRNELYDLLTKRRQVKNEASKKYYEKNRETINEARKAKYAEKVKAKNEETVKQEMSPKSDDEKSLETITTVVDGEVVRIKIDMSGDIPVFNVPADIMSSPEARTTTSELPMTPVDKKPRKPRAKVVAKFIPVENQEEFMKAVKKI